MEGNKSALVLSGGFAFGAYQVGVMLALGSGRCRHLAGKPFDADIFTGTSIGAVNCAILLSSPGGFRTAAQRLADLYLDELASGAGTCGNGLLRLRGNPAELLSDNCYSQGTLGLLGQLALDVTSFGRAAFDKATEFARSAEDLDQRLVQLVDLTMLVSPERFHLFVRRNVVPSRVRESGKIVKILAANWRTGALREFDPREVPDALLHQAIIASAAVPGLVPPVLVDGEPYADGGIVMNTGLRPAIQAGASELHVVYMDSVDPNVPPREPASTVETIFRSFSINLASMLNRDIEIATKISTGVRDGRRLEPAADAARGTVSGFARALAAGSPDRAYRELEIHRYRASADLGGVAGWLSFDRAHLVHLIEMGFEETIRHDCAASQCAVMAESARGRGTAEEEAEIAAAAASPKSKGAGQ